MGKQASSVRSYLRMKTTKLFTQFDHRLLSHPTEDAQTTLPFLRLAAVSNSAGQNGAIREQRTIPRKREAFRFGNATLIHGDCFEWLGNAATNSVEAVVTDPPYGLVEYSDEEQKKLRAGRGGVWRIPPSFDGNKRAPLPRFTVLSSEDIARLDQFFFAGHGY